MHRRLNNGPQVSMCSSSLLGTRGGAENSELAPSYLYIELYCTVLPVKNEDPTDKSQIQSPSLFLLSLSSQALRLTTSSKELSLIRAAAPKCGEGRASWGYAARLYVPDVDELGTWSACRTAVQVHTAGKIIYYLDTR